MRVSVCPFILALCFLISGSVSATSDQIEMTGPQPGIPDGAVVHGTAFFGAALGSKPYDTAGNLGATFHLGAWDNGVVYFNGDIFTWIKNDSGNKFVPKRLTYTLEPGYYLEKGENSYRAFIRHQSFHNVDFQGPPNESYELYGLSYRCLSKPKVFIQVGKYLNKQTVDYGWDFAGSLTFDIPPWGGKDTYFEVWAHRVTDTAAPRNGFTDIAAELGIEYESGITVFGRYEALHDIDQFLGTTDHHVLTGIRYNW